MATIFTFLPALFFIPVLISFYDKRIAKLTLVAASIIYIFLNLVKINIITSNHVIIIFSALILLLNPRSNVRFLALIVFLSLLSLTPMILSMLFALAIFLTLSLKRDQAKFSLYLLFITPVTIIFSFLGFSQIFILLGLLLIGLPPLHRWLYDLYKNYHSEPILIAAVILLLINSIQYEFISLAPILIFLGLLATFVGTFQCIISKDFTQLYSSLHQIVVGPLLISAIHPELMGLFNYLLFPSTLSLLALHTVHGYLEEQGKTNGILDFGGLSKNLNIEAVSALITYLILFTIISINAEVYMHIGLSGNMAFLALGCTLLLVVALSLVAFFRNYTLTFEGLSNNTFPSNAIDRIALGTILGLNFILALFPSISETLFSILTNHPYTSIEVPNILLIIIVTAVTISLVINKLFRGVYRSPWLTGYTSSQELSESKSEILTIWKDIFKPVYRIQVPIDKISRAIEKVNPWILLALVIFLIILGVLI